MTDIKSPEERSRNMAAIKGKNTKPELYIRKILFADGFRYRVNSKKIYGKPDIWLKKYRTAIFVNGCFWHHHSNCKYAYIPKSKTDYWTAKFDRNINRDREVYAKLETDNIRVLVIWECSTKEMKKSPDIKEKTVNKIEQFIKGDESFLEI